MADHNDASCDDPLCLMCEGYSAGYVDGKRKALFGVSTQTADHSAGCGCNPCLAVNDRLRRRAALKEKLNPDVPPTQDPECDRGGLPAGPQTELALLLGIELTDGDLL